MRSLSRVWVLLCAVCLSMPVAPNLLGSLGATPASAQARPRAARPTPIALGSFSSIEAQGSELLESALLQALSVHPDLRLAQSPARARYVVTGSVVELSDRALGGGEHEVRACVSIVVSDARGGAIRAMLEGRAGVRGGSGADAMRRTAIRGAAESALRSIVRMR